MPFLIMTSKYVCLSYQRQRYGRQKTWYCVCRKVANIRACCTSGGCDVIDPCLYTIGTRSRYKHNDVLQNTGHPGMLKKLRHISVRWDAKDTGGNSRHKMIKMITPQHIKRRIGWATYPPAYQYLNKFTRRVYHYHFESLTPSLFRKCRIRW